MILDILRSRNKCTSLALSGKFLNGNFPMWVEDMMVLFGSVICMLLLPTGCMSSHVMFMHV